MKTLLLWASLVWIAPQAIAQFVPVGQWQSHLSLQSSVSLAEGEGAIYVATDLALYAATRPYNAVTPYNKVTGLNDMGVSALGYHPARKALVIGYTNGNVDLMYADGSVINLPAIKLNLNLFGSKAIRHVSFDTSRAFLSCDFGLVALDLNQLEFTQTTFTSSTRVRASKLFGNAIYMATSTGLYRGALDGRNLLDFAEWERMDTDNNLPRSTYACDAVEVFKNKIYMEVNDTLFRSSDGLQFERIPLTLVTDNNRPLTNAYFELPVQNLRADYHQTRLHIATGTNQYVHFGESGDAYREFVLNGGVINDVLLDSNYVRWLADLSGTWVQDFAGIQRFIPNGPYRNQTINLATDRKGGFWATWGKLDFTTYFFSSDGFSKREDGVWTNYNLENEPTFANFRDVVRVLPHPKTNKIYFGSFMDGVLEFDSDDETYTIYDDSNSEIQGTIGDTQRKRITGLAFDDDNNLWISNHLTAKPIVVRLEDGTFKSFATPYSNRIADVAIDRNGYKWFRQESGNVLVFSEGQMATDGDEKYYQITNTANELASNNVNCVVADKNGLIWAGTDDGVTIFSCGQTMFEQGCVGQRPVINPDNFNGRLLESENVRTIAVDGANRKWCGTDNGVFVLSPDGYEQVYYFTQDNSPLFDNVVYHIAIDPKSGTVYMATGRGIVSFRGEATEGKTFADKENVYVFPNPVKPDYTGYISITNLPTDANVKITDISGKLVYEAYALGGQLVWDGYDYTGRKAASGVYTVYVVSDDAKARLATKFLIVN